MYNLSYKQQEAKEKLEVSLNRTPRGGFKDKDDFDGYMQFLIKKIKKNIKTAQAVKDGKISYKEIREKRDVKIKKYYSDPSNLKKYAYKYYNKYFPSHKKLYIKLLEKSGDEEISNQVLNNLISDNLIKSNKQLATGYFNSYVAMGLNYRKIKQKLYNKKFPKDIIEELVGSLEGKSLLDYDKVYKKIKGWYKQGKTTSYMYSKIVENSYDKDIFQEILSKIEIEMEDERNEVISSIVQNLKDKGLEKQKIISRLSSKGYRYSDFVDYL